MRTKHLLWALALPSVFAACTQDEFTEQAQGTIDNRPVVGAISLNIAEGPTTRWVYNGGFVFDDKDYIGAALMDTYNESGSTWEQKYSIVDYIQTNYKYGYKDGWTNNDAIMSEGNYFFYMPYNNQLKSRAGLPLEVPTEQFAYDPKAETAVADDQYAWREHQMFIGYDDVTVNDQAATPQLVEVFAKPRFNINYTGNSGVLVERVVVTDESTDVAAGEGTTASESNQFVVSGTLKPTGQLAKVYNPISTETTTAPTKYNVSVNGSLVKAFQMYNQAVGEYTLKEGEKFVSPLAGNESSFITSKNKSSFLSLNFVPAKEVTGLMVMPAGKHIATDLKIEVYTSKGLVTINPQNFDDDKTVGAIDGLTYSNLNVLSNVMAGDGSKANAININFNDIEIKQPASVTVATTSQLESIIRWYEDSNGTYADLTDKTLTINVTGDVDYTQTVYNAIKGNPNIAFKFVVSTGKKLNVVSGLSADALSLLDKNSTGTVAVKGTQTLSNTGNTAATYSYDIAVASGATLNVNGGSKSIKLAKVSNSGIVNVNGTVSATQITNYKDLTVSAGATLTAKILNYATAKTSNGFTTYTQNATLTNNGTLNLNNGSVNQSEIVNNNKLYIVAYGTVINGKVDAVKNSTNGYTGIIENANAQNSYIYSQGILTNNGNIDNTGAMYSQGDGEIANKGYIMANDGATTYVTTNDGDIELEKRTTETTVNNENGSISYTLQSSDLNSKGEFIFNSAADKFNTLKVGMNVQFASAKSEELPKKLILNATSNISVICSATGCKFTSIKAEGNVRYSVQGTKVETTSLTVNEGVVFQIPALSTFGVYGPAATTETGSITNNGEILVGGAFYSDITSEPTTGTWSSAGNGSYKWNTVNFGNNQ